MQAQGATFRIVEQPPASKPNRARPIALPGDLLGRGRPPFTLVIREAVQQHLAALCRKHMPNEAGGILGGVLGEDEHGPFVTVEAVEEVEPANVGWAHVSWSGAALNAARARLANGPDRLEAVGWWHSHGGMAAFFSAEDRREQASYGRDPRSVGLVVGRAGRALAAFHGPESIPVELVPVLALAQDARLRPCSVPVEHLLELLDACLAAHSMFASVLRPLRHSDRRALFGGGLHGLRGGRDPLLRVRMLFAPRGPVRRQLVALRTLLARRAANDSAESEA